MTIKAEKNPNSSGGMVIKQFDEVVCGLHTELQDVDLVTRENSLVLGSIRTRFIAGDANKKAYDLFYSLMLQAATLLIEEKTGKSPEWDDMPPKTNH